MILNSIELFAGCGGLALGMEKAGFHHLALNEFNKDACNTLKLNRPDWNVINGDVANISWSDYKNKVDIISGGFPCQAFSHSGKRLGFEDTRGTLFYEFARCIKEVEPLCFLAENVKGLLTHDNGNTINTIMDTFSSLGYHVYAPLLLNANNYDVAQKRERVLIFGVKKEFKDKFNFIEPPKQEKLTLKNIFIDSNIYSNPINEKEGILYSEKKKNFFNFIPEGGNWKNLPIDLQKEYLGAMFNSGGGKTGILKRLSMNAPSVTILTSPSQKQTDRCHPLEIRPLNVRESARIQSFPDNWKFSGSVSSQYKQIGNAVPVNLAYHVSTYIKNQILNFKNN